MIRRALAFAWRHRPLRRQVKRYLLPSLIRWALEKGGEALAVMPPGDADAILWQTPAWLEAAFTVALGAVLACLHALAAGDVPTTALLKQGAFAGAVAAVYLWMPRRCEKVGA